MRTELLTREMHIFTLKLSQGKHESYMFNIVRHFVNEAGLFFRMRDAFPLPLHICMCKLYICMCDARGEI